MAAAVVAQTRSIRDHAVGLAFYDRRRQEIVLGDKRVALPPWFTDDFIQVYMGRFTHDGPADFAAARMADTHYWRGLRLADLTDNRAWYWSFRDAVTEAGAGKRGAGSGTRTCPSSPI